MVWKLGFADFRVFCGKQARLRSISGVFARLCKLQEFIHSSFFNDLHWHFLHLLHLLLFLHPIDLLTILHPRHIPILLTHLRGFHSSPRPAILETCIFLHLNCLLGPFQNQSRSLPSKLTNQRKAFKKPCFKIFDIKPIELAGNRQHLICIGVIPAMNQGILTDDVGCAQLNECYFFLVELVMLVLVLDLFVEHDITALNDVEVLAACLVLAENELVFDEVDLGEAGVNLLCEVVIWIQFQNVWNAFHEDVGVFFIEEFLIECCN